ncbi:hypothetical protein MLD38_005145 [Melastoma candidum]|uniref:Uncharacterized protein n=1 Tax=Melastoma candidum TaxID=119954 RepID=A0ACB9S979_9MYRT|nr:hypothetical protein MLD38_005145 [Melastoma candidum]
MVATVKAVASAAASITASVMLARSMAQNILPPGFEHFIFSGIRNFFSRLSNELTLVIEEYDGLVCNELFESAQIYLASRDSSSCSPTQRRLRVTKPGKEKNIIVTMDNSADIPDEYRGIKLKWYLGTRRIESGYQRHGDMSSSLHYEIRFFELSFNKKDKLAVLDGYLPYIINEARSKKQEKKTLKLFTPNFDRVYPSRLSDAWTPVNLDHPATFETLAMEAQLKDQILDDLRRFVRRKDYYRRVGKAWKRGYLLYGPPGTGKSSLVAAMANYLNFDVYDLELTTVRSNSDLRRLLVGTANRSILVVEDIDCTIEFKNRLSKKVQVDPSGFVQEKQQVTLSGFLNFIDGIWSSCGDERIIVFTTNHKEKLDPALLRPGRMDVHVHMSYCTPCGFRLLAANYLGIERHSLFKRIEEAIVEARVTPAEVAEQLIKHDEADEALEYMMAFLGMKKKENEEKELAEAKEGNEKVEVIGDEGGVDSVIDQGEGKTELI